MKRTKGKVNKFQNLDLFLIKFNYQIESTLCSPPLQMVHGRLGSTLGQLDLTYKQYQTLIYLYLITMDSRFSRLLYCLSQYFPCLDFISGWKIYAKHGMEFPDEKKEVLVRGGHLSKSQFKKQTINLLIKWPPLCSRVA